MISSTNSQTSNPLIEQYKTEEQNVIAHECAHMSAGGALCGCASYTYEMKEDGNYYIVAGEVPITLSESSDPKQTISDMETVIRSSLAPCDPSGQDLSVASQAQAKLANAKSRQSESALDGQATF